VRTCSHITATRSRWFVGSSSSRMSGLTYSDRGGQKRYERACRIVIGGQKRYVCVLHTLTYSACASASRIRQPPLNSVVGFSCIPEIRMQTLACAVCAA
jgi:hypothetical protein